MLAKTDSPAEIGMHVFERAKLGIAPFYCFSSEEKIFQACPGAPIQPGSSCDYCGQGIRYVYWIKGRTGSAFKVGSDCVMRTGDAGLIQSYKNHPSVRAVNRDKAKARDERVIAEWNALIADETACEKLSAHMVPDRNFKPEPWLNAAKRAWPWCGMAGHARYLKAAKKIIAGAVS
jgi:hypothetical protein